MPIAKIEPTGCCVRKGKVQLRFSFYLESSDPRYEVHHVQVPVIPPEGYLGEVDAEGIPVDQEHYNNWIESLPRVWQNNPFHNHFVYVDANIPKAEIIQLITESLQEFFGIWSEGKDIMKVWKAKGQFIVGDLSASNIKKCERKVEDIIQQVSNFEVKK